jgi:hypothetical protein
VSVSVYRLNDFGKTVKSEERKFIIKSYQLVIFVEKLSRTSGGSEKKVLTRF